MNHLRYPTAILTATAAVLAAACSTETIRQGTTALVLTGGVGQGAVTISLGPAASTFEEDQQSPSTTEYFVRIDGAWAVWDAGTPDATQVRIIGAGTVAGFWLTAGPHSFELVDEQGVTLGGPHSYEIKEGQTNQVILFGARDDIQEIFTSYDPVVAAGSEHVRLFNILRDGSSLEVVTCAGPGLQGCTPAAPPIAYGQTFETDLPAQPGCSGSSTSTVGYRLVPSATLPSPAVNAFFFDELGEQPAHLPAPGGCLNSFVAAPVYHSTQGSIEEGLL